MVLMKDSLCQRIVVADHSYVGSARRTIKELATAAGLTGEPLDRLSLISSELATNLAKYATNGGELIFSASAESNADVMIWSVDKGPGIANLEEALVDGNSTSDTLGAGLGSLRRLSD